MTRPNDNLIAALTVALEARGESDQGQKAIGSVLRNRARRTGQGIDAEAIRPKQFSAWNGLSLADAQKRITPEAFQRAQKNLAASDPDPNIGANDMPDATHYFNPALANPKWDFTKMQSLGTIGQHQFYNEPGWRPGPALKTLKK